MSVDQVAPLAALEAVGLGLVQDVSQRLLVPHHGLVQSLLHLRRAGWMGGERLGQQQGL